MQLGQLPETGVLLWLRGVALHHLGRIDEAHDALRRARPLLSGSNLPRMLNDQANFYDQARQFRQAIETFLAALKAAVGDPVMQPIVTYNLGWLYLSRLEVDSAHEYLQAALTMGELGQEEERMAPRVGASTLDRSTGHLVAAQHRARLATEVADTHRLGNLAYRTYGHALRQLGDLMAARTAQQRAVDLAVPAVYKANETLILGIIDASLGREIDLEAREEGALPLDVTRSLLHRADQARRALREGDVRRLLQAATDQDEPFPVWDEAPLLHELYAYGRTLGFALPERRHTFPVPGAEVRLGTLGAATLSVAGRQVPVTGQDISALILLAYVTLQRQTLAPVTTVDDLYEQLYDSLTPRGRPQRLKRDLRTVNAWLGDPLALKVSVEEKTGTEHLTLANTWVWRCDSSHGTLYTTRPQEVFLPRGRGAWVEEVRRFREDARLSPARTD